MLMSGPRHLHFCTLLKLPRRNGHCLICCKDAVMLIRAAQMVTPMVSPPKDSLECNPFFSRTPKHQICVTVPHDDIICARRFVAGRPHCITGTVPCELKPPVLELICALELLRKLMA